MTFMIIIPIIGLLVAGGANGVLSNTAGIFMFSLVIAIPVAILATIMGFPIFNLIAQALKAGPFIKIIVAGLGSAFSCAAIVVKGTILVVRVSLADMRFIIYVLVPAILTLSLVSSCIFWWRTK